MLWKIDPVHSAIEFGVRHLGFSNVRGRFGELSGEIETDGAGTPTRVEATIATASVDTNNEQRDGHIRSVDILDTDKYPEMRFQSTAITTAAGSDPSLQYYQITGDLTLHGVTHPVSLTASVTQPITDHMGGTRVAIEVQGRLKRTDWGIELSQNPLVNNALLVGEEVTLRFELQAVKEAA